MDVRRATQADVELIAAFGARTFRAAFGAANNPDDIDSYVASAFSVAQIEEQIRQPGSRFLIAEDDVEGRQVVVAYAHLRTGAVPAGVVGRKPVELSRIYVDTTLIGGGYGSALLRACTQEARDGGSDVLWLGVWEHNQAAIRLYQRHGFRQVGQHGFLLGSDAQTDLVLALSL